MMIDYFLGGDLFLYDFYSILNSKYGYDTIMECVLAR